MPNSMHNASSGADILVAVGLVRVRSPAHAVAGPAPKCTSVCAGAPALSGRTGLPKVLLRSVDAAQLCAGLASCARAAGAAHAARRAQRAALAAQDTRGHHGQHEPRDVRLRALRVPGRLGAQILGRAGPLPEQWRDRRGPHARLRVRPQGVERHALPCGPRAPPPQLCRVACHATSLVRSPERRHHEREKHDEV